MGVAAGIAATLVIIPLAMTLRTGSEQPMSVVQSAVEIQAEHDALVESMTPTVLGIGMDGALADIGAAELAVHEALRLNQGNEPC